MPTFHSCTVAPSCESRSENLGDYQQNGSGLATPDGLCTAHEA